MNMFIKMLVGVAGSTLLATGAFSQSAKQVRGASPYVEIKNEPSPKLIVDQPLPEGLAQGVFWAQYRVENLHIAPVFGAGALQVLRVSDICTCKLTICGGGLMRVTAIQST